MSKLSSVNTEKGTKHNIYIDREEHFFIIILTDKQLTYNIALVLGMQHNDLVHVYVAK